MSKDLEPDVEKVIIESKIHSFLTQLPQRFSNIVEKAKSNVTIASMVHTIKEALKLKKVIPKEEIQEANEVPCKLEPAPENSSDNSETGIETEKPKIITDKEFFKNLGDSPLSLDILSSLIPLHEKTSLRNLRTGICNNSSSLCDEYNDSLIEGESSHPITSVDHQNNTGSIETVTEFTPYKGMDKKNPFNVISKTSVNPETKNIATSYELEVQGKRMKISGDVVNFFKSFKLQENIKRLIES